MKRFWIAAAVGALSLVGAGFALAAPPDAASASCQARPSVTDAQMQTRDDISQFVKSLGEPPGLFFSFFARQAEGSTPDECLGEP